MIKMLSVFLLAAPILAQAPKDTPKPTTPPAKVEELTYLEKVGLATIAKEYQQVLAEFSQANIDIAKNHPGYHLDPKNPLSGVLVKEEPKPKDEPKTPEKK